MFKFVILQACLLLGLLAPGAIAAETSKAREVVQTIIERAKTLDKKATYKKNAAEIESLVDFEKLANDALGANLEDTTPKQRQQIRDLLRKIITKTVYPEAPKFFKDVNIDFTSEKTSGEKVHITSVVIKNQKRATVEYWLAPRNGAYRVVDLAIEGERWVENVSDQFDEIIERKGVSDLIQRMQRRLKELEKQS